MDLMSRVLSPYDVNPIGKNPLRAILAELVNFERLAQSPIKLFITATNVQTGRGHVFKNDAITPDVLLASACLPTMFQAIKIDGEPYWDGGYSGNPTITPLIRECKSRDTVLVQINPVEREGSPRSASEILNRLNEVSFNAVLLKELRMMALLRQVANPGDSEGAQWAGMRIHRVASEMLTELGASSKLNAEWEFFSLLHDEGRRSAQVFLEAHASDLGRRSTLDLDILLEQI
jgi:NTE family protein